MDGLISKPEWLLQIYHAVPPFMEQKTWETRSRKTNKRERIYLLSSGGYVTGEATITDCVEITSKQQWMDNAVKHQVGFITGSFEPDVCYELLSRHWPHIYAWILNDIVKYDEQIKYIHPKGAIIWVKDVENKMKA